MKSVIYKEISCDEFIKLDGITIFYEEKTARRFGVITNEIISFKFSWQSDTTDPVIKSYNMNSFCCLGIDLMFSIMKFNENAFNYVIMLVYFFYDVRFIKGAVWVITELEILIIEVVNFSIVKKVLLPCLFHEIISESLSFTIECMDGEMITVKVP